MPFIVCADAGSVNAPIIIAIRTILITASVDRRRFCPP
jgi:hypothetical protein